MDVDLFPGSCHRVTVHGYAVHSNRMHTKWADRPFWRCNPRVSCDLCSQETPRGILPVKSNMRYLLYMRDRPGYLTCGNTGGIIHLCADTLRHGRQAYIRGNEKARGAKGKQRRAEKEAGEILWDRDRKKYRAISPVIGAGIPGSVLRSGDNIPGYRLDCPADDRISGPIIRNCLWKRWLMRCCRS